MAENILIISDLHLGEDLKPAIVNGTLPHLPILERELQSFLDHYRKYRRDGRPWHLIINGDMVDFLSVCLIPQRHEEGGDGEDLVWGLGSRPQAARQKMLRVFERHPGVFASLARFVAAGHRLSIVAGNHDVEFHWPLVQQTFKEGIAACFAALPAASRAGAATAAEIQSRVEFHNWFYFQENLVWVEHGHQYDDFCSFDYVLNPVEPATEEVVLSVGAASYRYVTNHVQGSDPHQLESWNFAGFVKFVLARGPRQIWKLAKGYFGMSGRMIGLWRKLARPGESRRLTHRERLRVVAQRFKLSEETLVTVDNLRRRPIIGSILRLMMTLMLDRVLLGAAVAMLALVFLFALPWVWAAVAVLATVGAAYGVSEMLERTRGTTDPQETMKAMPEKIRRHVSAPFVVFGHSHHPVAQPLDGGGMYFNTGTWVAVERPGLLHAFTHVMIHHEKEGPKAALYQWCAGRSAAYQP